MSSMHIYLFKNIYIVHRLPEKLAKSKRLKEDIAEKLETVQKNAKRRFLAERCVFAGSVESILVVDPFVLQRMEHSFIRQALSIRILG
jgi:hypothetical protein